MHVQIDSFQFCAFFGKKNAPAMRSDALAERTSRPSSNAVGKPRAEHLCGRGNNDDALAQRAGASSLFVFVVVPGVVVFVAGVL